MLQIEEFQHKHVLRNVLIDHGSVERVVLCSSEDEALQIISNNDQSFAPAYVRLPTGRKVYRRRNAKVRHRLLDYLSLWSVDVGS